MGRKNINARERVESQWSIEYINNLLKKLNDNSTIDNSGESNIGYTQSKPNRKIYKKKG